MAEQRTVQELEQAKAEAARSIQEIEESQVETEKQLAEQVALVDSLPLGSHERKEAMKNRDVLSAEKRRAESALSEKKQLLAGYEVLIQKQKLREAAARLKAVRAKELAARRELAKLFERVSGQILGLGETLGKISNVELKTNLPGVFAGPPGVLAERFRFLADQERRESERLESNPES